VTFMGSMYSVMPSHSTSTGATCPESLKLTRVALGQYSSIRLMICCRYSWVSKFYMSTMTSVISDIIPPKPHL
jgi:hypothetical protein